MFNTTFVGTGVLDCPQQKNFGRDVVFSADVCYNGTNEKPPSEREGAYGRARASLGVWDLPEAFVSQMRNWR